MSTSRDDMYKKASDGTARSALLLGQTATGQIAIDGTRIEKLEAVGAFQLARPIHVLIEPDDGQYLARAPDVPRVFGHGDDPWEALDNLAAEIASLWSDFQSGDDFTADWDTIRGVLEDLIDD